MAARRAQQLADRAVDRDRVTGGFYAAKGDVPVFVRGELAAQIHVGLEGVLVLVKAFGR